MSKENILIIGSGGREHALGWKLKNSHLPRNLYFAPGNAGMAELGEQVEVDPVNIDELIKFSSDHSINLTVVGPELPLEKGIVDRFTDQGLSIFGPSQAAARLETSKAWANDFMTRHNIPHPVSATFTDVEDAIKYVNSSPHQELVVKASGLAAGKGVEVCDNHNQAIQAVKNRNRFGPAGKEIIIQERLFGREVSALAFCDGRTVMPLLPAQDHKPVFDNDQGPNTGGMGAYAPVPFITAEMMATIQKTILQPTVDGMKKEGYPYKGVLYAGLMITKDGPKVLEYNARFGDPETQPLMMLLESDLAPILIACINETLDKQKIVFRNGAAVCVVLAENGYPDKYEKGHIISGLEKINDPDIQVFHAGTLVRNGQIVTNGGRVLGVTAYGNNITDAIKKAYSVIGKQGIYFNGMQHRKDIGKKATL